MRQSNISRIQGFTLMEIMIAVSLISLLAIIAIPNFVKARATSQQNACINNMRKIDDAVNQWALEKGHSTSDPAPDIAADLSAYIKLNSQNSVPGCPAGGDYTLDSVGAHPQVICSKSSLNDTPHIVQ